MKVRCPAYHVGLQETSQRTLEFFPEPIQLFVLFPKPIPYVMSNKLFLVTIKTN